MQKKIGSSVYRNSRTIFWRETFTAGRYVLVACTFEPSLEGQFLLRCYAGHAIRMKYELAFLILVVLVVEEYLYGTIETEVISGMIRVSMSADHSL